MWLTSKLDPNHVKGRLKVSFARDGWTNYFHSSVRKMDYANRHFTQIGGPEWLMLWLRDRRLTPVHSVNQQSSANPQSPATLLDKSQERFSRMMSIKVTI